MTTVIDEMLVKIRASADGVKEGVAAAKGELSKLDDLRLKVKLALDESGINAMRRRLDEIHREKQELNVAIRFGVSDAEYKQLKSAIAETRDEIKAMEDEAAKLGAGGAGEASAEYAKLRAKIEEAREGLRGLEEDLKVTVNADEAKRTLSEISLEEQRIERNIAVNMETEGITRAEADMRALAESERQAAADAKRLASDSATAYTSIGAAGAAAFAVIASAVKSGVTAYQEVVEAQTKLANIMSLTMGANSERIDEIVRLTETEEALGVVSARVQQAGAQELATYLSQTDTLKKLIPVMNDMVAQQHGYNASSGQTVTIATMLGNVMDGQVGKLKRYGYAFSEEQEAILKTGEEAARAAVLFDIVNSSIGGTNAALAQTDSAKIAGLRTAAEEASAAFGEALTPALADMSEAFSAILGGVKGFAEAHPALVTGVTATAGALTLGTAAISAYQLAATKLIPAIKAVITANTALTASFGIVGAASLAIGAIIGIFQSVKAAQEAVKKRQEELNAELEMMNGLLQGTANADNIEDYEAEISRLKGALGEAEDAFGAVNEARDRLAAGSMSASTSVAEENDALIELARAMERMGLAYDDELTAEENYMAAKARMAGLQGELTAKMDAYVAAVKEANFADFAAEVDKQTDALGDLRQMIGKVNDGTELSVSELRKLSKEYPAIAELIAKNGVEYGSLKTKMEEVYDSQKRLTERTIKEEIRKTEAVLTAAQTRIGIYAAEIAVMGTLGEGADWAEAAKMTKQLNDLKTMLALVEETGKPGGGSANAKELTDYEREIKLLEQKRAISEQTAAERLRELETVAEAVKRSADEETDLAKRLYSARKDAADEWLEAELKAARAAKGMRDDNTDYQAVIDSYQQLKEKVVEIYKDYPETLKAVFAEIDEAEIEASKKRADKVLAIESAAFDKRLELYGKQRNTLKSLDGLTLGDGSEFSYGTADEIGAVKRQLDAVSAVLEEFGEKCKGELSKLTDAEKRRYDELVAAGESYNDEIISLSVRLLREEQTANQKALDEAKKAAENQLKAIETLQKDVIAREKAAASSRSAAIKERYASEIAAAKEASRAEVAVYEARIAAIDELMKQESRQDRDESLLDRIRRAQEQLKYETSDANKYELSKEIANLRAEYEKNQRTDALTDEKERLRAELDSLKNGGAARIAELERARDAEIALEQEALLFYTDKLEAELEALKNANAEKVGDMAASLEVMKADYAKNQKELAAADKKAARARRETFSVNISDIISDLRRRLGEFADVGYAMGDALARSYRDAVSDLGGLVPGGSAAAVGGAASRETINLTNNFYSPAVTPSMLAAASERAARDLVRYG